LVHVKEPDIPTEEISNKTIDFYAAKKLSNSVPLIWSIKFLSLFSEISILGENCLKEIPAVSDECSWMDH